MRNPRAWAPAIAFMFGSAFVWNARSQDAVPLVAPIKSVMAEVPGYQILDQKLSDEERRVAGMTDYVARIYVRDSVAVFNSFVSYYDRQTQGKTIHSPRNCLPGAGWEILTAGTATLNIDGRQEIVNKNVLKNGAATAVVYYWYQGRGRIVANEYAVKWNLLRDAAVERHTEEALVRIVVPVPGTAGGADPSAARRELANAAALGADLSVKLAKEVARILPNG
jgi:EpsI family protein